MSITNTSIGSSAADMAAAATGTTGTTPTNYNPNAKKTGSEFGMDKDAFLKILVEQLRHQNPSQPGDSQEYIAQMTQYSMLEQLTNISEATQIAAAGDAGQTALGLVGRTVTYLDDDGEEHTGQVESVDFKSGAPLLTVAGQKDISIGSVVEVRG